MRELHMYYPMEHSDNYMTAEVLALVEPYVECGYSAHQIKDELSKHQNRLIPLGYINLAINTLLGE